MRWIVALFAIIVLPLLALAQGVDNPGSNNDVICTPDGVCNSFPGGGGGGGPTTILTDDAVANIVTDDADANLLQAQ